MREGGRDRESAEGLEEGGNGSLEGKEDTRVIGREGEGRGGGGEGRRSRGERCGG